MISFSTEAEKRWRTQKEEEKQMKRVEEQLRDANDEAIRLQFNRHKALKESLPKGKSFSVILVREVLGNLLINLRAPNHKFRWSGDWAANSFNWD